MDIHLSIGELVSLVTGSLLLVTKVECLLDQSQCGREVWCGVLCCVVFVWATVSYSNYVKLGLIVYI